MKTDENIPAEKCLFIIPSLQIKICWSSLDIHEMAAVFYTAFQRNLVFKPISPAPLNSTVNTTEDTLNTTESKLEQENRENNNVNTERITEDNKRITEDNKGDKDINLNRTNRSGSCSDVVNQNRARKREKLCQKCQSRPQSVNERSVRTSKTANNAVLNTVPATNAVSNSVWQSRSQSVDGRSSTQSFQTVSNAVPSSVSAAPVSNSVSLTSVPDSVSKDDGIDTNFACLKDAKPPIHSRQGSSHENLNLNIIANHSMGQKPPCSPSGARSERFRGRRGRSRLSMHEEVMLRAARNRSMEQNLNMPPKLIRSNSETRSHAEDSLNSPKLIRSNSASVPTRQDYLTKSDIRDIRILDLENDEPIVLRRGTSSVGGSPRAERPVSYPARCRRYPGSLERYMAPNFEGYEDKDDSKDEQSPKKKTGWVRVNMYMKMRLYFFIGTQIVQVAQPVLFK